jgi:hypothetical protein
MQINFAGDLGKRMPEKPYTEHIPNLTAGRWNIHCALESQAHLTVSSKRIKLRSLSPQEVLSIGEKRMVKLLWPQESSPC